MDKKGELFRISKSVRQGDPLFLLEAIFREIDWEMREIKINVANGVVIMAENM